MRIHRRKEKKPGSRKRLKRLQKRKSLEKLWLKAGKKDLKYLVLYSEEISIQKQAWEIFKTKDDVGLDDVYELTTGPGFIEKELWQMFLDLGATPEDLLDVLKHENRFQKQAWKELKTRMKSGAIKKARSKRILIEIVELIKDLRKEAWKLLKRLNPSEKKLQEILDMPFGYSEPELIHSIETFIRKKKINRTKKDHGLKIAHGIETLFEEIQELKKGQE